MSKLKLVLLILIIGGLIIGGIKLLESSLVKDNSTPSVLSSLIESDNISWYQDPDKNFNLAIFKQPIVVTFVDKEATQLEDQANIAGYKLAINGGYLRGDSYLDAEYAGLLQIKGKAMYQIATGDNQLTHIVVYDEDADILKFEPASNFPRENYTSESYTLFQTGPLLIKDNVVQVNLINKAPNGTERALRTVLGYTNTGEKFVVVTRSSFTLEKLADTILNLDIFKGKIINVVNLDGGTSSAMFSKELSQFNFGSSKRLPAVIGVK